MDADLFAVLNFDEPYGPKGEYGMSLHSKFSPVVLKSRAGRRIIFDDLAKQLDLILDRGDNEFTIDDDETKATRKMLEATSDRARE